MLALEVLVLWALADLGLSSCEVLPSRAAVLQLEDPAFVGVEEIFPRGDAMRADAAHFALRPALGTNSPAVLDFLNYQMNAIVDPVFNAGRPCRNQSATAFTPLISHSNLLDVVSSEMAATIQKFSIPLIIHDLPASGH